ncbi:MAG: MFS transporter [Alphaproteobacteria bacterium]|nr:MFS transporter [Alphaproteobacteria bacterium]
MQEEFRRGWRTLLACSTGNAFGLSGLAFYTFGVFVVPLVDAFGWQRGQVASAASFLLIGTAITAPIVGTLIDRFGARKVGLISMFILSLGYLSLTQLGSKIAFFYAAWLLMSLSGGGTTPVVWTRAVNLWFDKGRGLALGLCLAGSGVAAIISPPMVTAAIQNFGWQGGYVAVAAIMIVISLPIIAAFFDDQGPRHAAASSAVVDRPGIEFRDSFRHVEYWKIAIGFFFVAGIIAGLIINLVPLLIDRGMTRMGAAEIAGIMGFAVLIGRIGIGFLLDKFNAPMVARVLLTITAGGCLLLAIPNAPVWVAAIAVISLGFAAAAEIDMVAYFTSRYFGMKAYGKIYGSQLTIFYAGAAAGPAVVGLMYDAFGSYLQSLYAAGVILVFGAIVVGSLGKPPEFESRSAH